MHGFCVGALWFGNWGLSAVDSVVSVCRIVWCVRCSDLWTASAHQLHPRVFNGEVVSEKPHDVHKVREVSNKRLTDSKSHNKVGSKAVTSYEVEASGITINSSTAPSSSIYPDMV